MPPECIIFEYHQPYASSASNSPGSLFNTLTEKKNKIKLHEEERVLSLPVH